MSYGHAIEENAFGGFHGRREQSQVLTVSIALLRFFRDARRALHEEKVELQRETKETVRLLQDIAKRHMDAERECDGASLDRVYGREKF